jgi:hypothetical protein
LIRKHVDDRTAHVLEKGVDLVRKERSENYISNRSKPTKSAGENLTLTWFARQPERLLESRTKTIEYRSCRTDCLGASSNF